MPCLLQPLGRRQRHRGERADRHQQHVVGQALGGYGQHVHTRAALDGRNVLADITLREPQRGGPGLDLERLAEFLAQPRAVARRGDPHAGHDAEDRQVPHPVVAGAVGSGDTGAVEHHGHRQLVQRDVHHDLVERPVQERRVDRHHRVHATHRQTRRRCHRVLLGDADVEEAVRDTAAGTRSARWAPAWRR